ncbi:MAG: glutamate racemase [Candidatus Cloacimonadia bacterium]
MQLNHKPIGIFDSGVGGLTVYSAIRHRFPYENLIYFGDTARVPYGPKSKSAVIEYSVQNSRFLYSSNVKLIVVACNTSSAVALTKLRELFDIPIIGVLEPGAQEAVRVSKNGRIGIIGTEGTLNSQAYPKEIQKIDPAIKTFSASCPLFVPLAEEGWEEHAVAETIAQEYLKPLLFENIDTLVLGCTHYPILKKVIQKVVGDNVILVDSAEVVSRYLDNYLKSSSTKLEDQDIAIGKDYFYVSDNEEKFRKIATRILNREIGDIVKLKLAESWFA